MFFFAMGSSPTSTRGDNTQPTMSANLPQVPPPAPFDFGNPQSNDPEKIKALANLEPPTDISGMRWLLGISNHLGCFFPHLSDVTAPIRALLQKRNAWVLNVSQQNAFQRLKGLLHSDACMAPYYPSYHTTVSAGASSYGCW